LGLWLSPRAWQLGFSGINTIWSQKSKTAGLLGTFEISNDLPRDGGQVMYLYPPCGSHNLIVNLIVNAVRQGESVIRFSPVGNR
jgi:hypothetical protein